MYPSGSQVHQLIELGGLPAKTADHNFGTISKQVAIITSYLFLNFRIKQFDVHVLIQFLFFKTVKSERIQNSSNRQHNMFPNDPTSAATGG